MSRKTDIDISVLIRGEKFTLKTYIGEYRNLMVMLYEKLYVEGFGECKGIGRCGTCHIRVLDLPSGMAQRAGNETTTLSKMTGVTDQSRLACQIVIDQKLNGLVIEILSEDEL